MSVEAVLMWNDGDYGLDMKIRAIQKLFTYRNCIRLRLLLGYTRKQWSSVTGIPLARVTMLENNVARISPVEALAYAALAPANFVHMWDDNVETATRMFPCSEKSKTLSESCSWRSA